MRSDRAFELCGAGAVLMIQKTVRGFLVRQAYARRFEEAVRVRVLVPAAGVLQKCWRGMKGREEGARRRRMWAAATEIQARVDVKSENGLYCRETNTVLIQSGFFVVDDPRQKLSSYQVPSPLGFR